MTAPVNQIVNPEVLQAINPTVLQRIRPEEIVAFPLVVKSIRPVADPEYAEQVALDLEALKMLRIMLD